MAKNSEILGNMLRPASLWTSDEMVICLDKILACHWIAATITLQIVFEHNNIQVLNLAEQDGKSFVKALVAYHSTKP